MAFLFFTAGCSGRKDITPTGIYNDSEYTFSLRVPIEWKIVAGYLDEKVIAVSPAEDYPNESFRESALVKVFPLFDGSSERTEEQLLTQIRQELEAEGYQSRPLAEENPEFKGKAEVWVNPERQPGSILTYCEKVTARPQEELPETETENKTELTSAVADNSDALILYSFSSLNEDTMKRWEPIFMQYLSSSFEAEKNFVLGIPTVTESSEEEAEESQKED